MVLIIAALLIIGGMVLIWFHIPYSPLKHEFQKDVDKHVATNRDIYHDEVFRKEDFAHLPMSIQKFVEESGYLGKRKMTHVKLSFKDVDFYMERDSSPMKIDYTEFNFVKEPSRVALIDTSMYGLPFEGYDRYLDGKGSMKGVVGKTVTVFHERGLDMDRACLATYLAESMFAPSILLQDWIKFEELSDYEVQAEITYKGQRVAGVFTFNKNYEMIAFTTNDRANIDMKGEIAYMPWSALCTEYKVSDQGIKYPSRFQAVWKYPDKDFKYFDGVVGDVTY